MSLSDSLIFRHVNDFSSKSTLVTGANGGLGKETVKLLMEAGFGRIVMAAEMRRRDLYGDRLSLRVSVDHYTQAWPLPENVGIHLDRDDGLLVTRVVKGSPAARAGIQGRSAGHGRRPQTLRPHVRPHTFNIRETIIF